MTGTWKRGTCNGCHQPVIWALTEKNKRTPVDPVPDETGTIELTGPLPRAVVRSKNGRPPGQKLYVSHWKSCPKVAKFRARQAAKQARPEPTAADQGALFGGGGR